jgi:hypothetical protein
MSNAAAFHTAECRRNLLQIAADAAHPQSPLVFRLLRSFDAAVRAASAQSHTREGDAPPAPIVIPFPAPIRMSP